MLLNKNTLATIIHEAKNKGEKVVFTNGCFDIIHSGHVKYLSESSKLGDILVVGLNSDDSVKRLKGSSRPVNNQNDRAEVLSALKSVDFVCIFDEDTPFDLISILKPDIITKGGDYKPDEVIGADIISSYGGKVVIIDFVEGKSTSRIIEQFQ